MWSLSCPLGSYIIARATVEIKLFCYLESTWVNYVSNDEDTYIDLQKVRTCVYFAKITEG